MKPSSSITSAPGGHGDGGAQEAPTAQTVPAPPSAVSSLSDEERASAWTSVFWQAVVALWRARWLVIGSSLVAAIVAVVISLNIPNEYEAGARVLPPESGGGGLGALIGDLSPIAASMLQGGGSNYTRYLSILTSRSTLDRVVQRFHLIEVYEVEDDPNPQAAARAMLFTHLNVGVDLEYDFMFINAIDRDPRRAADIANFLVQELNRRNQELSAENAGTNRRYIQERYEAAETALDSLRGEMQRFQEAHGVIELPTMAQAFMESVAQQEAQVTQAEVQYEALRAQYGPDNPEVQAAQEVVQAARRAQSQLMSGGGAAMPVPMRQLPALANEYARLYQQVLIQGQILEASRPLYEQARFEEERQRTAVQVLDDAVPPTRKSGPHRSLLVITTTLSAFILLCIFVVVYDWLRRNRAAWSRRLQEVN